METNKHYLQHLTQKFAWLFKLRPMPLATFFVRLLAPDERRRIIETELGLKLYLDPFSHLGHELVTVEQYEPETVAIFKAEIQTGNIVLDIGANEGFFSALAGKLVGNNGLLIAIEPQSRLRDLIEINLRLNQVTNFKIYNNALGGDPNSTIEMKLYPSLNTGASSIVHHYRFAKETELVKFVAIETIFTESQIQQIDFVKVDVEGFEHKVVDVLSPFIQQGKIKKLLLDYHASLLREQGINPFDIHQHLLNNGMFVKLGNPKDLSSYILYEYRAS
ncbi:FkbM family methyltransferase [Beggiatoa leptomitoformis]|uniref:FkbM family methyltransferase n=1 Tax=Beggiatoa leptomitoformis TaxID=288004 RepID=A0A2N9YEN0_9GAMM|nr:FkbM family methyltransferase [Beggiatoa leptomitoformis]ALG68715.1 FkbM family methyltransferase [Beggiatoa leptomitoformis]AUI68930.1 FkbM family methyltransferase [Beggiatoa leptomitoformis]